MKVWIRVLLFIAAFQLEVRVRASDEVMQEPAGCLQSQDSFCVVKAAQGSKALELSKGTVLLQKGSILKKDNSQDWTFVEGLAWFRQGTGVLRTVYGSLTWASGDFWIESQDGQILIRNVSAKMSVTLRDGKKLPVPEGFQFWISGLDSQSKSKFGMLQPIEWSSHLKNWASLYPGTSEQFKIEVKTAKESFRTAMGLSSEIYQASANRQIASVKESAAAEKRRLQSLEEERRRLKEIYFQRTVER